MVAKTFEWYSMLGTKDVIKDVLDTLYGDSDVKEWFEYGGKPYFFKVLLKNIPINRQMFKDVIELVYELKNVRSWLEGIISINETRLDIYVAHAMRTKMIHTIEYRKVKRITSESKMDLFAANTMRVKTKHSIDWRKVHKPEQLTVYTSFCVIRKIKQKIGYIK